MSVQIYGEMKNYVFLENSCPVKRCKSRSYWSEFGGSTAHCPMPRQLHRLSNRHRILFKIAGFVFLSVSGQAPAYLADDCCLLLNCQNLVPFPERLRVSVTEVFLLPGLAFGTTYPGRVQQPTGRIGRATGMTYVRQVSCWTTLILIQ